MAGLSAVIDSSPLGLKYSVFLASFGVRVQDIGHVKQLPIRFCDRLYSESKTALEQKDPLGHIDLYNGEP